MNFVIEKAVMDELPEILSIYESAKVFMASYGNDGQWDKNYPCMEDIEKNIKDGQLYVCRAENDKRIAVVFLYFLGIDEDYTKIDGEGWFNNLPYGVMHKVAAADFARGTGAAVYCIDFCFKNCGNLKIDTHEKNIPMQRLLHKSGFKKCGEITLSRSGDKRIAFQKSAKLILASKSPRRMELIKMLDCPFMVDPASCEEVLPEGIDPKDAAQYLAAIKAEDVFNRHKNENPTVIGSDTVVVYKDKIFGKPADREAARSMLKALQGNTHEVYTGVVIKNANKTIAFTSVASVSFYKMSDSEIEAYINTGEPMDKAGAYGIQGKGALYIEKLNGDFYTVMGFPIAEIYHKIKFEGIEIC
ncbi:MAG: Maf family protein [Eubacteriales bacterium]|nr:Maf family protein [Eubacteriales bacterium]